MKLLIAWNVWDNYGDVLLGSEIARRQNDEQRLFDALYLISQGGYPEPPSDHERQYLDEHIRIEVDEENPLIRFQARFAGLLRVLKGIRSAYEYAHSKGCDYALVTNGDAWCLDSVRLRALLEESDIERSAVSARVWPVSGLNLSYGSYVPVLDDHFLIINVQLCSRFGVFDYDEPRAFSAMFAAQWSIHYMLLALMDERIPPGLFHAYTNLLDCVNQFGELTGWNLIPWQYQPSYTFLHANCAQEPDLHPLRAEMLRHRGLNRYPAVAAYCREYATPPSEYGHRDGYAYYKQAFRRTVPIWVNGILRRSYYRYLRVTKYGHMAPIKRQVLQTEHDSLYFHDRDMHVLPTALASRRNATPPRVQEAS